MTLFRIGIFVLANALALPALAQENGPVEISKAVAQGVSRPLRDIAPPPLQIEAPWIQVKQDDSLAISGPVIGSGVDGIGFGFLGATTVDGLPPSPVGAVGATQYVQMATLRLAVFDKATKAPLSSAVAANALWSGFSISACAQDNDGDAIVLYDKASNRWVISQFAIDAAPYYECIAVSQTSDALGAYYLYAFSYGSNLPDYPKMGVWPDGYYATFNMFDPSFNFFGVKVCAYDRVAMLAGGNATQQCFQLSNNYISVLPADLDGATAPPSGSPNYLLNLDTNSLNLWRFHVDWTTPANSTLDGPTNIPVAAFTQACPTTGTCVPQSGTSQKLDTLSDRLMFRLAYRNFGAYESLVGNHSVQVGATADASSGVRWYEIRSPGTSPVVYQQSTFAPDATFRWMSSMGMDHRGNMALGYSASSGVLNPAIRTSARLATDTLNTLQAEASLIEGAGSQTGFSQWGFYTSMSIDPSDDCTFWYTNEYLKANGTKWSTHIDSLKFPSCGPIGPPSKLAFTVEPGSSYPAGTNFSVLVSVEDNDGNVVSDDSATPVSLAVSACGSTSLGTITDTSGVAQFDDLRFYHVTSSNTIKLHASAPGLGGVDSTDFSVTPNADLVFHDGLESCTP